MEWCLEAAHQGHPAMIFSVADAYSGGRELVRNMKKSAVWEAFAESEEAKMMYAQIGRAHV